MFIWGWNDGKIFTYSVSGRVFTHKEWFGTTTITTNGISSVHNTLPDLKFFLTSPDLFRLEHGEDSFENVDYFVKELEERLPRRIIDPTQDYDGYVIRNINDLLELESER